MVKIGKRVEDLLAAFERLSRRERLMLGGLLASFLVFVTILLSLWISSGLHALERRVADRIVKLQTIIDLRQQFEEARQAQKRSQDRIRTGSSIQLFGTLENLAKQLGINIEDMQRRPPTVDTESRIAENKVEVNIQRITIDRLVDFLQEIQQRSKTIAVRNLHIRNSFKDPTQLEVGFTVSNFQLMEEKEGAPAAPTPPKK